MRLVLLSGGSGKRLWPLSNDTRSKQFLKVFKNGWNEHESMVQRVWGQLKSVNLASRTVIATSKSQVEMIQDQIGLDAPILVEPERRDTFPAIALAATYLYSIQGMDLDEALVVLPVDPYVQNHFFEKIKELENLLEETDADIALLGVVPSYPSEKYGYIVPKDYLDVDSYMQVKYFQEKPSKSHAIELIEQNALWNCGVFACKLRYIISILQEKGLPISYKELLSNYHLLSKISFDYEIVEKAKNIVALLYTGYWKDLGTWNTLTDAMDTKIVGKGIICENSQNTHLINELNIPIITVGLSNVVVAASPDGILITDKKTSAQVKTYVNQFNQRPMYEERRWGSYKILDYTKNVNEQEVLTKKLKIKSGRNISYQLHYKRNEVWTILQGEGEFVLNDVIFHVKAGDVLQIPERAKHGLRAISDMEIIEVQRGSQLIEEDIERIYMTWGELVENCSSLA
ncbi:sugar phosphate nucleotidyltransferase [Bacillus pacificus]|uniref:sugar phosphate nucleotidyltransferase n=1 Tax=Bacillus pacificus TaxID=2026187 RepID=UPI002E1B0F9A|nr:sugar phosphate nucleotidyltransferase [Bacillus pacificus]